MNEKLNFHDLVGFLSEKAGITKKDAENFLREFFDLTTNALLEDKQVKIKNLGTFKVVDVNDRESVDVRTGERVVIPSHSKVSFVPDTALSKVVNEPFAMFEPVEVEEESETETETETGLETESLILNIVEPTASPENTDVTPTTAKRPNKSTKYRKKTIKRRKRTWLSLTITALTIIILALTFIVLDYDNASEGYDPFIARMRPNKEKKDDLKLNNNITKISNLLSEGPILGDLITNDTVVEDSVSNPETEINVDNKIVPEKIVKPENIQTKPEIVISKSEKYTISDGVKKRKIAEGERLTIIALQEYGSKEFWVYLYEENKSIIKNPGNVVIGTVITIPPASKYGIDKNNPESINKAREMQKRLK